MNNLIEYAVIDIQGVFLPEFFPKELTILHSSGALEHYTVRAPTPWQRLGDAEKKLNNYVERFIHGIKYSFFDENTLDYYHLLPILANLHADVILVKGHQKKKFLEPLVAGRRIINLETWPDCPKLDVCSSYDRRIECTYHSSSSFNFKCSRNNVHVINNYIQMMEN